MKTKITKQAVIIIITNISSWSDKNINEEVSNFNWEAHE